MDNRFRNAAAAFIAIVMVAAAGMSSGVAAGPTHVVAQASPEDTASPTDTATAASTMEPMKTMVPAPSPGAPTPDANGVTPVKQGGTTENSNGSNWLEKFNRRPGPDKSDVNAPLDVPIHNGPGKTMKKPMKPKVKKMNGKPPA